MIASDVRVADTSDGRAVVQFWTRSADALLVSLGARRSGLSDVEAAQIRRRSGPNADAADTHVGPLRAVANRLLEPLSLILLAAGVVSALTGDGVGGAIIVGILSFSIGLDTFQEGHALHASEVLRRSVALNAEALRDGSYTQVKVEALVPGDVIRVRAGDIIPADALMLEGNAFTANEASLTGEPYPVEKRAGLNDAATPSEAWNAIFRGSVAQTGEAIALVVGTGRHSIFGEAAAALVERDEISPFKRDLHAFGLMTARLTIALVLAVFATHMVFGRPVLQSLLFGVALAVGLTPELLPMITTVTLSRGAMRLAAKKVIIKRLASIHDLGAMTVLCTDKTGTLTSAEITLARSLSSCGHDDAQPALLGSIAAILSGDRGALDAALIAHAPEAATGWRALGRRSFDFSRRTGSVLADGPAGKMLIVKGAPEAVLALCSTRRAGKTTARLGKSEQRAILKLVQEMGEQGLRAIAIASRVWTETRKNVMPDDESHLIFEGLCTFADPPKASATAAIARLAAAGIQLKILSGDDPIVVKKLATLVGLNADDVFSGADVAKMSDAALRVHAHRANIFGRLTPDQKSRIIKLLQARGEVVGYLGDGINDAPALKGADIGISVSGATGVAQAAADMILLDSDLAVVADGVEEGRRTFANILKYIRMGASSNFGNMLSMAGASLFLPFLPMLPTQILLNNLLYDVSEIGIPFDAVRREALAKPMIWDMHGLICFAGVMGGLSSVFDFLTFGGLLYLFKVSAAQFQTAWFMESMASQILVIFIIRTNGRSWRDRPRPLLVASSLGALALAVALPFTPVATAFGFVPLPLSISFSLAVLTALYLVCAEALKGVAISMARKVPRGRALRVKAAHNCSL
jgi:P-type Mg2+ transporter